MPATAPPVLSGPSTVIAATCLKNLFGKFPKSNPGSKDRNKSLVTEVPRTLSRISLSAARQIANAHPQIERTPAKTYIPWPIASLRSTRPLTAYQLTLGSRRSFLKSCQISPRSAISCKTLPAKAILVCPAPSFWETLSVAGHNSNNKTSLTCWHYNTSSCPIRPTASLTSQR